MKPISFALVLTTSLLALTGAGFLAWSAAPSRTQTPSGDSLAQLEPRFTEVLERVQRVETGLASLEARVSARTSIPASVRSADPPSPEPARSAAVEGTRAAPARTVEDLRGAVYQLIQEEREERQLEARQEALARAEQKQKEIEELYQGPYGDFNYRVNTLARRLKLTDPQKQQYYNLLINYSSRIEEMRSGLDRNNPEVYAAYRERKKQVQEEFEGLVSQSLTPVQAKAFQGLSFSIRSAALEAATGSKEREAVAAMPEAGAVKVRAAELKPLPAPAQAR